MRRPKRGEPSASTMFPFLAVLLCTMGAMVVLLVAMAAVARDKAAREAQAAEALAAAARDAADSPERREAEARLAEAEAYAERLREIRQQGEERLAEEQARLSDIEDHLRRLRDEAEELLVEDRELAEVEQEHYDDQEIAERELERLNRLAIEIEDEIEQMKHAASGRQRKYAVVALRESSSGTLRPPVYLECTKEGVILQPEGVEFPFQDLAAPSQDSPIAAAARAVVRYYREHPEARAANEAGDPYPLLLVRPDGMAAYTRAEAALAASGNDFGYQPVGEEWELEFGEPNPILWQRITEAAESARRSREQLARVMPGLRRELFRFRNGGPVVTGGADIGDSVAGNTQEGSEQSTSVHVQYADPESNNPFEGIRITTNHSESSESPAADTTDDRYASDKAVATSGAAAEGGPDEAGDDSDTEPQPANGVAIAGSPNGAASRGQAAASSASAKATASSGSPQTAQPEEAPSPSTQEVAYVVEGSAVAGRRDGVKRDGLPIVRPITLRVGPDEVFVENSGDLVGFAGRTDASINSLIDALRRHADGWGIAGEGMHWEPVLHLEVKAGADRRANEVASLLDAVGLSVRKRAAATAARPTEGRDDARRQ